MKTRNIIIITVVLLTVLISLSSCSTNDDLDDCGCTKTTYAVLAINNHLVTQVQSVEYVDCQDEGSEDLEGNRYYTIKCQ